jgi:hypothetical protein
MTMLYSVPGNLLDSMVQGTGPVFQNLVLVNLPVEVLESIFHAMDSNDAQRASSTCRHLRTIGMPYAIAVCLLRRI